MLSVKLLEAFSLVSLDNLHLVFPTSEHALSDISTIFVIAAYMYYLTGEKTFSHRFMLVGSLSVVIIFLATSWWWVEFISANPESKFGQTWCDWAFRINASVWFAIGGIYLWFKSSGWRRNYICLAILCFFLDDFLKIPDMALGENYESVFAPIRGAFYLLGILIVGYVYLRGHASSLYESHESLEIIVQERTRELADANDQLLELTRQDPLTLLANRRAFEHDYQIIKARVNRGGGSIAVILIDVDHFKKVNDTYGHQAGDACLQALGIILKNKFKRDDDIVARYGGEEFVAAVGNLNIEKTLALAESLRVEIENTPIVDAGETINITVSIGITQRGSSTNDDTESLFAQADAALYEAKESGRNRICIS